MTYAELYVKLEKELIEPMIHVKKDLSNYDAFDNMKHFEPSEVFESLKFYEQTTSKELNWNTEVYDGLELACKNDIIMFIADLEDIK